MHVICHNFTSIQNISYKRQALLKLREHLRSRAGTVYPSGALEFTPVFSGVRATRSLVLCVCFVDRCLSLCPFSFGHCVVCSSSIYGFWLPLWYLQTLLTYIFPSFEDLNYYEVSFYFGQWQYSKFIQPMQFAFSKTKCRIKIFI
jgi:hypothetical protein